MGLSRSRSVSLPAALMIMFVSLGAFVGTAKLVAPEKHFGLTMFSFASYDDEDSDSDDSDEDEDKDDDEDEDKDDDEDKAAEKEAEKRKKESEKQRTMSRSATSGSSASSVVKTEDDDADDTEDDMDEDEDEDENESEGDEMMESSGGMYKEKEKTLERLNRDLAKAEEDIMKQAEKGVDVSPQLAALAAYRAQLSTVGEAFDVDDLDTAKSLAKQLKKEAYFLKKSAQDVEKVAKEMQDVMKRFAKADAKIAELEALGGDTAALKAQLDVLRSDYAVLESAIAAAPGTISRDTVKTLEKKVQRVKSAAELALFALGADDDGELAMDHEDESDDIVEHLFDVAEIEDDENGAVTDQVRSVAQSQRIASRTVKSVVDDFEKRSRVTEFFLGTDQDAAARLTAEISAMQSRATVLESAAAALADPDMKRILLDQAAALRAEAAKFSTYLNTQNAGFSLFGWLFQ